MIHSPSRRAIFAAVVLALPLGGCLGFGSDDAPKVTPVAAGEYNDYRDKDPGSSALYGSVGGVAGASKDNRQQEADAVLGVNAYLWRGALDTMGFMPLASADPFGGVIITDWYSPPTVTGERFKATVYILGRELRSDGVRVSVFRQTQEGGTWVDATVNPGTATDLENNILARARELRAQTNVGK